MGFDPIYINTVIKEDTDELVKSAFLDWLFGGSSPQPSSAGAQEILPYVARIHRYNLQLEAANRSGNAQLRDAILKKKQNLLVGIADKYGPDAAARINTYGSLLTNFVKQKVMSGMSPTMAYVDLASKLRPMFPQLAEAIVKDPSMVPQVSWSPLGKFAPYLKYAPIIGGLMTLGSLFAARKSESSAPLILGLLGLGLMASPYLQRWYAMQREQSLWSALTGANKSQQQLTTPPPPPETPQSPQTGQGAGNG